MDKQSIIFLPFIIWLFSSCWGKDGRYENDKYGKQVDEFYITTGGWDWVRVPLIKPYEAKKIDPEIETNPWNIDFKESFGTFNVRRIDVQDSVIYILSGRIDELEDSIVTILNGENLPTAWYIIDTRKEAEKGFASEQEFERFIKDNKYPTPKWHNIDSLSNEFGNGVKVPWLPK